MKEVGFDFKSYANEIKSMNKNMSYILDMICLHIGEDHDRTYYGYGVVKDLMRKGEWIYFKSRGFGRKKDAENALYSIIYFKSLEMRVITPRRKERIDQIVSETSIDEDSMYELGKFEGHIELEETQEEVNKIVAQISKLKIEKLGRTSKHAGELNVREN